MFFSSAIEKTSLNPGREQAFEAMSEELSTANLYALSPVPLQPEGLFRNGDWQTLYTGALWRPAPLNAGQAHVIPVAERAKLLCSYYPATEARACLILMHGLEASAEEAYMRSLARKLLRAGVSVLCVNHRSCGPSVHLSNTTYHAGLTQDVNQLVDYAHQALGYDSLFLGGFSLGANLALKYAGEQGQQAPETLRGVFAVSPPVDLEASAKEVLKARNAVYERFFYGRMFKRFLQRFWYYPKETNLLKLRHIRHLIDFHHWVVAPDFGFASAQDYHLQASCGPDLPQIQVPTLMLYAQDDPIIPLASYQGVELSASTQLLVTRFGGHVGFRNGATRPAHEDACWAENRVLDFIRHLMET